MESIRYKKDERSVNRMNTIKRKRRELRDKFKTIYRLI